MRGGASKKIRIAARFAISGRCGSEAACRCVDCSHSSLLDEVLFISFSQPGTFTFVRPPLGDMRSRIDSMIAAASGLGTYWQCCISPRSS